MLKMPRGGVGICRGIGEGAPGWLGGPLQEVREEEGEAALLWEGAPPPIGVGGATRLETTSLGCRGCGGKGPFQLQLPPVGFSQVPALTFQSRIWKLSSCPLHRQEEPPASPTRGFAS